jgi:hypothetical protein
MIACRMATETQIDARRAALERLIDHAALFPPASMSIEDALAEDRRVRAEPTGWIVNRFVVPASRLAELGDVDLRLSVVADAEVPADSRIEAVEIPPSDTVLQGFSGEVYVERPIDSLAWLDELDGRRAKVRCGGAAVPSSRRSSAAAATAASSSRRPPVCIVPCARAVSTAS